MQKVQDLLASGKPVDAVDEHTGITPLMDATLNGDCAAATALLDAGASIFGPVPLSATGLAAHAASQDAGITRGWQPGATITPFELAIEAGQVRIAAAMLNHCSGREQAWRDGRLRALIDTALARCNWEIATRILEASSSCGLRLRGKTINARYAVVLAHRQWPLADSLLQLALSMNLPRRQVQMLALQSVVDGAAQLVRRVLQHYRPDNQRCCELLETALNRGDARVVAALLDNRVRADDARLSAWRGAMLRSIALGDEASACALFGLRQWPVPACARILADAAHKGQFNLVSCLLETLDCASHEHRALAHRALCEAVTAGHSGVARCLLEFTEMAGSSLLKGRHSLFDLLLRDGNAAGLAILVQVHAVPAQSLFQRLLGKGETALVRAVQDALDLSFPQSIVAARFVSSRAGREAILNNLLQCLQRVPASPADQGRIAGAALLTLGLRSEVARAVVRCHAELVHALSDAALGGHGLCGAQGRLAFAALLARIGSSSAGSRNESGDEEQLLLLHTVGSQIMADALAPLASSMRRDGLGSLSGQGEDTRRSIELALVIEIGLPQAPAAILAEEWVGLAPPAHRLDSFHVRGRTGRRGRAGLARSAPAALKTARRPAGNEPARFAQAVLPRLLALHAASATVPEALQPWYAQSLAALVQICESVIEPPGTGQHERQLSPRPSSPWQ
ncbi:MAG: hypothetical protein Q7T64_08950 [Lacisediminimonas sp.]|nr:hypothetical protein [Lacisediminimonas sp.]